MEKTRALINVAFSLVQLIAMFYVAGYAGAAFAAWIGLTGYYSVLFMKVLAFFTISPIASKIIGLVHSAIDSALGMFRREETC